MFDTADAAASVAIPLVREPHAIATGDKAGPWVIESELGRGGMSVVYAVHHEAIGKKAALKILHDELCTARNAERILLEAQVVNAVSHPGIVDIFETGTLPDGRAYIVMERLEGADLGTRAREGRLLAPDVIDILLQVCSALAAAHAHGIVHRDLKPDNVFLAGDPQHPVVKLLDWGIAKVIATQTHRTLEGSLVGTPHYLAPEQARGAVVSPLSDVYSLGVMAYELFLEELPFDADSAAEVLAMHLREAPPNPRDLWPDMPSELATLLLAMLAKTPEERPSLAAVVTTLESVRGEIRERVRQTHRPMTQSSLAAAIPFVAHMPTEELLRATKRVPRWQVAVGASAFAMLVALFVVGRVSDSRAASVSPAAATTTTADAHVADPELAIELDPPATPSERELAIAPPAEASITAGTLGGTTEPIPAIAKPRPRVHIAHPATAAPRRGPRVDPDGTLDAY